MVQTIKNESIIIYHDQQARQDSNLESLVLETNILPIELQALSPEVDLHRRPHPYHGCALLAELSGHHAVLS